MSHQITIPPDWIDREISVVLVGCGGTGSEMLDELYRMHTLLCALGGDGLNVTAYDPDAVSEANIGRQRFWPCDVGFPKAEVLITRINSYGGADWSYVNEAYDLSDDRIGRFDILITCVDTPKVRADIGRYFERVDVFRDRYWLDCGNDNRSGNVVFGSLGKTGQAGALQVPNVFDLYPILADMETVDEPSCSTAEALARQDYGVNRSIAREGANIVWQLLRHGKVAHHGSYIDIKEGTVNPLPVDPAVWETFRSVR